MAVVNQAAAAAAAKPAEEAAAAAAAACPTPAPLPVEAPAPAAAAPAPAPACCGASGSGDAPGEASPSKPGRCNECRKKVGLTGFKCKCGQTFCGTHRYAEAHACTYDYKTAERAKLADANPLVQAAKIQKI